MVYSVSTGSASSPACAPVELGVKWQRWIECPVSTAWLRAWHRWEDPQYRRATGAAAQGAVPRPWPQQLHVSSTSTAGGPAPACWRWHSRPPTDKLAQRGFQTAVQLWRVQHRRSVCHKRPPCQQWGCCHVAVKWWRPGPSTCSSLIRRRTCIAVLAGACGAHGSEQQWHAGTVAGDGTMMLSVHVDLRQSLLTFCLSVCLCLSVWPTVCLCDSYFYLASTLGSTTRANFIVVPFYLLTVRKPMVTYCRTDRLIYAWKTGAIISRCRTASMRMLRW